MYAVYVAVESTYRYNNALSNSIKKLKEEANLYHSMHNFQTGVSSQGIGID